MQEVEAGLGLPTSAPTVVDLKAQQLELQGAGPGGNGGEAPSQEELLRQLHVRHAAAGPEGLVAMEAAVLGTFGALPTQQPAAGGEEPRSAQAGTAPQKGAPAAVAFDNEAANLAAASPAGRSKAEE